MLSSEASTCLKLQIKSTFTEIGSTFHFSSFQFGIFENLPRLTIIPR